MFITKHDSAERTARGRSWLGLILLLTAAPAAQGADRDGQQGGLKPGDYVAVVGDSITEQKQYSVFIEDYLLMCKPVPDLRVSQFGWGGETSWGFSGRMDNDLLRFKPTVTTTCYGMNDGGYSPMNDEKARKYHAAQTDIVRRMKEAGVRFIVVGSPGAVDTDFFRRDPRDPSKAAEMSAMYNKTLASLRDIARRVAQEQGVAFADVYGAMYDAMPKAKAKFGKDYHVCGGDGFHPDANGHLLMAYAFLKALGCDGDIGTITIDLADKKAEASEGHKVVGAKNGSYEFESTKYPFCFYGDPRSPSSTRGIIEVFPFNEELNRFKLVVKNAPGERVTVKWGDASKEFAAADLAKGINLAAEFADGNPFSEPFKRVEGVIRKQQNFETPLVKSMIHNLRDYQKHVPEESEALDRIAAALMKKHRPMVDASAAAVKPVRHVIRIEAAGQAKANSAMANPPTMKPNAGTPDNTPPEGFTAAFNGKDLTGWKGLMKSPLDNPYKRAELSPADAARAQAEADEDMRAHWKVEDGALVFDGKGRSLVVAKDYGDFEMWVDWKIKEKGDSGLYVRGTPQIQIWDPEASPQNKVGSGGLFNNKNNPSKPLKRADKPVGEWNTFFIRMVGDKVTVYLNGELVVDNTPLENFWSRQMKRGDLPLPATGQIELQNHGNTLWFKNIYIRELPAAPDK